VLILLACGAAVGAKQGMVTTPTPPTLLSPGNHTAGTTVTSLSPTFSWNTVFDAETYGIVVRKDPYTERDTVFKADGVTGTSLTLPGGILIDGEEYRWFMRAHNSAGWSDPSARFSFRVELPAQKPQVPRVVSPGTTSEGSVVQGLTPTFKWEAVPGAERYGLYISKHPFGETNVVYRNETIKATTFSLPKGVLATGEKYRWNVRALGKAGWGSASNKLYFATRGWAVAAASAPKQPDETIVTKALPDDKSADERATEKAVSEPTKAPPVAPVEKLQTSDDKPAASQALAATDNGRERKKEESKDGLSAGKENSRKASPFVVASSSLPSGVIVEGEIPRWRARDLAEDQDESPVATREKPAARTGPVSPPVLQAQAPAPGMQSPPTFQPPNGSQNGAQPPVPLFQPRTSGETPSEPPIAPAPASPSTPTVRPGTQQQPSPTPMPRPPQATPRPSVPPPLPARPEATPQQPSRSAQPMPSGPPASMRTPPAGPGGMVQMQFDNIELRDLIKFVSNIMQKNFIFDEAVVKGRVTVLSPKTLTRDEVFRVFESVLNYYGFTVVVTPEAIKIVRSADAKGMAIEKIDQDKLFERPAEERITTYVQPLEYLDSTTMVGIIRPLMSKDAYLVAVPATNSLIMIDTGSNLQRLKKLIAEVDLPISKQLSGIDVYNVQHTNAADLAKVLQALLAEGKKAQTPKEKIFITSYAPTNSLLVSAPPEDMKEIRRIIAEIDSFRPQVVVEAAIIEVSLTKGDELGIEWLTGGSVNSNQILGGFVSSSGSLLPFASAIASGTIPTDIKGGLNIGVIGKGITLNGVEFPSVQAFIRALSTEDRVNILSTPQILTLNNEEAEIIVGENRPYLTSTRLDSAGNPINTFDYRDVGVKLKVKPVINKDGLVYLNVFQEVTKITVGTETSTGTTTPTTLKRSTKTTVGVKDNQTIVIGGLIRDDSTRSKQGIPFLSSLPLLGPLFGVNSKAYEKTNLLVFITPKIVYNPETLDKIRQEKQTEQQKLFEKSIK
jgi:general secretion pathway protein D